MKNLVAISNSDLLQEIAVIVQHERRITCELIAYLREIERRMLFAEMGFASLFEFTVKHLGLSEGSAHRRISAMRLIRDVPTVKEAIENGELSLSSATKAHVFFRAERKAGKRLTVQDKEEVIQEIAGLSQRDCDKKLFEISPGSVPLEKVRVVSASQTELRLIVGESFIEKLAHLKGLYAHSLPLATHTEILEFSMTELLRTTLKKKMG